MASTGPTNSINDQAIHWAVETSYGNMTPEGRAELEAWLAADTRHRGAFVRARAWMRATDDAVAQAASGPPSTSVTAGVAVPASDNDNAGHRVGGERALLWEGLSQWRGRAAAGIAALAVCAGAMIAAGVPMPVSFQQPRPTASEEVVPLEDGSIATLSPNARIEVALSSDYRRITLLTGTASFKVAKDKSRPFVVQSGDVYAQATGTVYSVKRVGPTGGTVKVTEGSVLVWPRDERDQAVLVHAGGSVTLDPGPMPPPVPEKTAAAPPDLPPPDLAQISLDNVPIQMAVARFNRLNSTKIVIVDPEIGHTKIIGLYRADDPEAFAQAAAAVSDGIVEHHSGRIEIKLK